MSLDLDEVRDDDTPLTDRLDEAGVALADAQEAAEAARKLDELGEEAIREREQAAADALQAARTAERQLDTVHSYLAAGDRTCPRCDGNFIDVDGRETGHYCRRCDVLESSPPPQESSTRTAATALSLAGVGIGIAMFTFGPWTGTSTPLAVLLGSGLVFYALQYGGDLRRRLADRGDDEEVAG